MFRFLSTDAGAQPAIRHRIGRARWKFGQRNKQNIRLIFKNEKKKKLQLTLIKRAATNSMYITLSKKSIGCSKRHKNELLFKNFYQK